MKKLRLALIMGYVILLMSIWITIRATQASEDSSAFRWAKLTLPPPPATSILPSLTPSLTYTPLPSLTPRPTNTYAPTSTPRPTSTYSPAMATSIANGCIRPFDSFAYDGPNVERTNLLPLPPGQIKAQIPPHHFEGYYEHYSFFNPALTRPIKEQQELWLIGDIWGEGLKYKKQIIIYRLESKEWEFISGDIDNTGLEVANLFITSKGAVWGRATWGYNYEYQRDTFPVLSKFNEMTRRFEVVEGVLELPVVREIVNGDSITILSDQTRILLDTRDNFWIFTEYNGIYRYDLADQTTQKQAAFEDFGVGRMIFASDGSMIFWGYNDQITQEAEYGRIAQGSLFQFSPKTGVITHIDLPDDEWPYGFGLLLDRSGRLWLGSAGYREPDGRWHLIARPENYFNAIDEGSYSYVWDPPTIIYESSDGRLWYRKYLDTSGWAEGTAWYDPETGEGCMFTNYPSYVVEDSEQQMWMVADGELYKYALNSNR